MLKYKVQLIIKLVNFDLCEEIALAIADIKV